MNMIYHVSYLTSCFGYIITFSLPVFYMHNNIQRLQSSSDVMLLSSAFQRVHYLFIAADSQPDDRSFVAENILSVSAWSHGMCMFVYNV